MKISAAWLMITLTTAFALDAGESSSVAPPPDELRESLNLSPFYQKHASAGGFPILASDKVSDYALLEARWLINQMLDRREDIRQALVTNKVRFAVMGVNELTTDIPEHSDLTPKQYWDRRARGLGATRRRPAVSCGEENLLKYPGDPYATENILIHEFGHAIHEMGLKSVDKTFDERLKAVFEAALEKGLWKGTYASRNKQEYWAEGVQSWFDTNRENDADHNHINTRAELKEYDLGLAELLREVFGDGEWRYVPPAQRPHPEHLAGYDPQTAPRFAWPKDLIEWYRAYQSGQTNRSSRARGTPIGSRVGATEPGQAQSPEPKPKLNNAEAVSGTWVLQQVANEVELERLIPGSLRPALSTPDLRGLCLRVPWKAIDRDFSLLETGLKLAREHKLNFSVRFMAGRHTPERVFTETKASCYSKGNEKIPTPFNPDGSPNTAFEQEYDKLVAKLAAWSRAHGVRLLHLAWCGQDWAELNHGKEVRAAPGYSYENWLKAHLRLLDIGLKHAGGDLAVELPFSGYGPLTAVAVEFADHVVKQIGPNNPKFFCQANGWGPGGDWGAPTHETEAAFDRVWAQPICRGQQAIQPGDYDWTEMFAKLRENRTTYCEVYAPSFGKPRKELLAAEIRKFAAECREKAPLPR